MKIFVRMLCVIGWAVDLVGLVVCGAYLAYRLVYPTHSYRPGPEIGNFMSLAILIFLASVFFLEYIGKKMTHSRSSYFFILAIREGSKAWLVWLPLLAVMGILFYFRVDTVTPNDGSLEISNGVYQIMAHAKVVRIISHVEGERILNASYNFDALMAWIIQAILFFYWDGLRRASARGELVVAEGNEEGAEDTE